MNGSIRTGGMRCRGAGRGIEADFGPEHAHTFRRDLHPDYVLANPPFNDSDWFRTAMREAQNPKQGRLTCRVWEDKDDDVRWQWREARWTTNGSPKGEHIQAHQYPSPKRGNANLAWVQHFIHHLAPHGMTGFVLANGSISSHQSGEGGNTSRIAGNNDFS